MTMRNKITSKRHAAYDNGALVASATSIEGNVLLARDNDSMRMLPYWDLSDALVIGVTELRNHREKYLPKFSDENRDDYAVRLKLTKFTNIYRDIVESLASKPFEEEISIVDGSSNSQFDKFCEDVDGSGNNLTQFGKSVFFNGINSAIDWIFVDYPTVAETAGIRTVADLKASGTRPFWSHVLGRNILSVKSKVINGSETLTYMKIHEPGDVDRVRVFTRDDGGVVTWQLWEKTDKTSGSDVLYAVIDAGAISIGIIPLVPFYTGRRDGKSFFFHPAMRDAADLSVELYQDESALKYARTMTAFPMLAGNGVKPQTDPAGNPLPIRTGPGRVLYAPADSNGKIPQWAFIEIAASSLTFLSSDIDKSMQNLREIGRQPLTAQSGNLTVITTAVAAGKARSAVAAWSLGLKDALENAALITLMWLGDTSIEPEMNVYDEFDDFNDSATDQTTLNTARAARDLSQRTYWHELQRRGVLSAEFEPDDEEEALLNEVPADVGANVADVLPGDNVDNPPVPLKPGDPGYVPPKPKQPPTGG